MAESPSPASEHRSRCPGCGVVLPSRDGEPAKRLNATLECQAVRDEVVGFEVSYPSLARRFHQLTVDTYGVQHSGGRTPRIYVAYSLVGLYLGLERGMPGIGVRRAHQLMGKPSQWWPLFLPPGHRASVTVLDVAEAGAANSPVGHADAVSRWAWAVWGMWREQHDEVAALTERLLGSQGTSPRKA